jgi:hypothetical protein
VGSKGFYEERRFRLEEGKKVKGYPEKETTDP